MVEKIYKTEFTEFKVIKEEDRDRIRVLNINRSEYFKKLREEIEKLKIIAGLIMGDIRNYYMYPEDRLNTLNRLLTIIYDETKDEKVKDDLKLVEDYLENISDYDGRILRNCNLYIDSYLIEDIIKEVSFTLDDLIYMLVSLDSGTDTSVLEKEIINRLEKNA